ncbi:MAG: hypothetical protein K6F99_04085 [Lachnospiraceae bacterium]|nr:hypothetical protein [Lachnospiraceae bacterium]
MDFGSNVANMAKSMVGLTAKAVIEITDLRGRPKKEEEIAKLKENKGAGFSAADLASSFNPGFAKSYINNVLLNGTDIGYAGFKNSKKKVFTVQFNPSEIRIGGYAGGRVSKLSFQNIGNSKTGAADARVTFSARLIFDKTDTLGAFPYDKFNMSPSSIATGVAKLAKKGVADRSVQPEVEAFTAALRDPDLRLISFIWGDMRYEGILNTVASQYAMFNTNGEPCRAFVDITIVCVDEAEHIESADIFRRQVKEFFGNGLDSKKVVANMGKSLL